MLKIKIILLEEEQIDTESIKGSELKKNWISVGANIKKDKSYFLE